MGSPEKSSRSAILAPDGPPSRWWRKKAVLVNLFTSEERSSCPPADDLAKLVQWKPRTNGGRLVGRHQRCTFNLLGTPRSLSVSLLLSRLYTGGRTPIVSRLFPPGGPTTPQMVINGAEQKIVGSRPRSVLHAVRSRGMRRARVLSSPPDCGRSVNVAGNTFTVNFFEKPAHGA